MGRGAQVTYYEIEGGGLAHARDTLRRMAELAHTSAQTYEIRSLATRITANVPSKQPAQELAAIYRWVRDHIRYRFDPVGIEWLQSPQRTIAEKAGDCDDLATLISSLAQALGHRVQYRTVGPTPTAQKHVSVQAWTGRTWLELDPVLEPPATTTSPRADLGAFGRRAPGAAHTYDGRTGNMLNGYDPRMAPLWRPTFLEPRRAGTPRVEIVYRSNGAAGPRTLAAINRQPVGDWPNAYDPSDLSGLGAIRGGDASQASTWWWHAVSARALGFDPNDTSKRALAARAKWWNDKGPDRRGYDRAMYLGVKDWGLENDPKAAIAQLQKVGKKGRGKIYRRHQSGIHDVGRAAKQVAAVATKVIHAVPGLSEVAMMVPGLNIALPLIDAGLSMLAKGKIDVGSLVSALPMVNSIPGVKEVLAVAKKAGVGSIGEAIGLAQKAGNTRGAAALASVAHKAAKMSGAPLTGVSLDKLGKLAASYDAKHKPSKATIAKKLPRKVTPQPKNFDPGARSSRTPIKKFRPAAALKASPYKPRDPGEQPATRAQVSQLARTVARLAEAARPARASASASASGSRWPEGSRQIWDPASRKWIVISPKVAGLGAIRPTLTFSLGAAATSSTSTQSNAAAAAAAQSAVSSVRGFIARKGVPPQIKLTSVRDFQATDSQLDDDGLWGPNSRAAAAWYLGVSVATLPPVAKPFLKYAVTWQPPAAVVTQDATRESVYKPDAKPTTKPATKPATKPKAKPTSKPASKPTTTSKPASKPTTTSKPATKPTAVKTEAAPRDSTNGQAQRQAAARAVAAVRTFAKKHAGKSPQIALSRVRDFQATWPGLDRDGLWGVETRAAAAAALRVPVSSLPPVAVRTKPATTKPATSKPATTTTTQQADTKPGKLPTRKKAKPVKPKRRKYADKSGGGQIVYDKAGEADTDQGLPVIETRAAAKSDNTWLWLAGAYYLWKRRRAA